MGFITEIFYRGTALDLYAEKSLKYNIQVNDIAELKDRQASYSNSYSLPKTAKNVRALSGLGIASDTSQAPYTKHVCQVKIGGFDFVVDGWMVIKETQREYKVAIYSGLIEFFKSIEKVKIGELPISLPRDKGLSEIIQSWTNPNQKYLLADYGGITHFDTPTGNVINADYLVPSMKVSYLWDLIFDFLGYNYTGSIFSDEDFDNLWLVYPNGLSSSFFRELNFKDAYKNFLISDFIKEILVMFGLTVYPDEVTKNLIFKTVDERFKSSKILDWSKKYISRKSESYTYETYGQNNFFKYKHELESQQAFDGNLNLENENIPVSKTVFSSKFYAADIRASLFQIGSTAFLSNTFKLLDESESDAGEVTYKELKNRFMFIRATEKTGTIALGSKADPSVVPLIHTGTFFVGTFEDLSYQFFVNKYYNGIYNVLNNSRIHDIDLRLSVFDVLDVDLGALYYFGQEQSNYILNRLSFDEDDQSGEFVKVDPYTDYVPIVTSVSIKFTSSTEQHLEGVASYVSVEDLGVANLGARTIVSQKWFLAHPGTTEHPYTGTIKNLNIRSGQLNSIFLRVDLSDGSVLYSNVLEYVNTLERYCYRGIWETGDPEHNIGGTVAYVGADGDTYSQSGIYIENIITVFASSILGETGVLAVDCSESSTEKFYTKY